MISLSWGDEIEPYRVNNVFLQEWDLVEFPLHPKDAEQFPSGDLVIFTINIGSHYAVEVWTFWQIHMVANTPSNPFHRAIHCGFRETECEVVGSAMSGNSVSTLNREFTNC